MRPGDERALKIPMGCGAIAEPHVETHAFLGNSHVAQPSTSADVSAVACESCSEMSGLREHTEARSNERSRSSRIGKLLRSCSKMISRHGWTRRKGKQAANCSRPWAAFSMHLDHTPPKTGHWTKSPRGAGRGVSSRWAYIIARSCSAG